MAMLGNDSSNKLSFNCLDLIYSKICYCCTATEQKETNEGFIYTGRIAHSLSLEELEFIEDGVVVIVDGVIQHLEKSSANLEQLKIEYKISDDRVFRLSATQFLIPGFIDTHIHGPQYPNVGLGSDLPLLQWLNEYTYPLEKLFSDPDTATKVYTAVVERTLSCGTTTACYYATIHEETALILAKTAINLNQRAFVGKVNMTVDTPVDYGETLEESLKQTQLFLNALEGEDLVKPIITPRFALSCDMETMTRLAELARLFDVHIQTHISENKTEIQEVLKRFPDCATYAAVYDKAGLLTNKTVLAHGVYLSDEEISLLKERGAAVSHCPNSNIYLQSGICQVRRLLSANLKVGLGTDCSGGYGVSMLDSIRHALESSIAVSFINSDYTKLSLAEVFFLATLGGAITLSIENKVGNFLVGKEFDALVVDMGANPAVDLLKPYTFNQLFQKFIYLSDDRNITNVYVKGKQSHNKMKQ